MNFMTILFRDRLPAIVADFWFKFVGYLFTCSALRVAAERSESNIIWLIYFLSFGALNWWLFDEAARLLRSVRFMGKTKDGPNFSYFIGLFIVSAGISASVVSGVASAIEALLLIENPSAQT